MKLYTPLGDLNLPMEFDHRSKFLLCGSCFAENIGEKLKGSKFLTTINPMGISYNPISLFNLLSRSLEWTTFSESEVEKNNDLHYTFDLHSTFSNRDSHELLKHANRQLDQQKSALEEADCLVISLGTAWVHILKERKSLVNNCHKLPAKNFDKELLEVSDIVEHWTQLYSLLKKKANTSLQIIFTVSPIRHLKDGFHENQISKATLQLAVNEICSKYINCHYFPSYELMMDELRDYRFYKEDLVHPSDTAIQIIWDRFQKACISVKGRSQISAIQKLMSSFHHKAFEPTSERHQQFLRKLINEMDNLQSKSQISFDREINELKERLLRP